MGRISEDGRVEKTVDGEIDSEIGARGAEVPGDGRADLALRVTHCTRDGVVYKIHWTMTRNTMYCGYRVTRFVSFSLNFSSLLHVPDHLHSVLPHPRTKIRLNASPPLIPRSQLPPISCRWTLLRHPP